MDYQEEQLNEIEALDSIYYGDMEILEKDPHVFKIPIQSDCVVDEHQMNCLLRFQYTPKYPEEIPIIEIENCDNIDEDVERELKEYLLTQANENLGKIPTVGNTPLMKLI
ncbi:RWD domain-containing protein 1-like [Diaphorina citri]|uniref:RWD domain-containing protein 1-like n=1 Tax=Diaphorina citri TaxID=121845 RepID=A0A3Q0JKQ3_DIACI|nr:RWD domain-containing protein 1-like [Diaphorina citri]